MYHCDNRWVTHGMTTVRPRYQVTETPAVARALDRAAKRWPGEARSKLLLRRLDAGGHALERDQPSEIGTHRAAVTASSGAYADAFPSGFLAELREEWPA